MPTRGMWAPRGDVGCWQGQGPRLESVVGREGVALGVSGGCLAMGWRKHGRRLEQGKWALRREGLIWAL